MTPIDISGRALTRNSLLNFVGQAGTLLVGVAAIPFIVTGLGVERFGLLSIAWIAPEFFSFIDLGLGRATTKYVAEALGKGDEEHISGLVWSAMTVQVVLGCIGSLTLIGITPFLTGQLLNIPAALEPEAKGMFYVVALSIPPVLISTSLIGLLGAGQRFELINAVSVTVNIVNIAMTLIGVLILGWGVSEIAGLLVTSRFLGLLAYYRLCIGVFSSFRNPRFHFSKLPTLLTFGGWVTVSGVIIPALLYMDRLIIGASLTMAAVAYYSVPYEVVTRLWIIPLSAITVLFPAFSTLTGQGQREQIASLLAQAMKCVLLTIGPAVVIITAFARDFLQFWLGTDFARESSLVVQILAVAILVNSVVQIPYAMVQAVGRPDITAKFHLVQIPLHGLAVWWLVNQWGVVGAAIAQAIRMALEALMFFAAARRLACLPLSFFVSDRFFQSLIVLFIFVGLAVMISNLSPGIWPRLLGLGIVFSAVGVTVWRYSLGQQERKQLLKLFWPAEVK